MRRRYRGPKLSYWLGVSTQDLDRGDQMSDEAETWFQNGDSHDQEDPVQVWEKTHNSSDP